jgi:hypothetical protein
VDLVACRRHDPFQRLDDLLRRRRASPVRRLNDIVDRQDALQASLLVQDRQAPDVALAIVASAVLTLSSV